MLIGVDEPRHDGHARGVDDLRSFRNRNFIHRPDPRNPLAFDDDGVVEARWCTGRVDEKPTDDGNGSIGSVRRALRPQILTGVLGLTRPSNQ